MKSPWLLSAVILAGSAVALQAEPYIAVRTGFKCSVCHVNGSGGGKRTDYGYVYSQYQLLLKSTQLDAQTVTLDPKLNNTISVGANFRMYQSHTLDYKWTSQDTVMLKSVNLASADNATINEGNLYLQFDLIRNFFTAYMDETMAPSAVNREMWGKIQLPWSSYFKFGNMLLPYGYRLMDDQAYVRSATGYTYGTSGLGYEVGIEPGPLSVIVNMTPTRLSSVNALVFNNMPIIRTFRVGGSYGTALPKAQRAEDHQKGGFAGLSVGMFTVLGERDFITKDSVNKTADYVELDFLPTQGLNFKTVYEYFWPDESVAVDHNGMRRITFGVEPFVAPFLQLGLYYRKNDGPPQVGSENQDEIVGRLHAFF